MKRRFAICLILSIFTVIIALGNNTYASVDDFVIKDFQADYFLSKDSNNRSVLKTVEKIVAEFPNYDQNHGIERAIPKIYDGHSTNINLESVVDENGSAMSYSTSTKNNDFVIRIGDKNKYVHGIVTYVITYSQNDVTRYFKDSNSDEFYWDVNGNGWSQNFEKITARLYVDASITSNLNGKMACYYGAYKSNNKCEIHNNNGIIVANQNILKPGQNMTIAVGFNKDSFVAYQKTPLEIVLEYLIIAYFIASAIALIFSLIIMIRIIILYIRTKNVAKTGRSIIPEYLPPKNVDIVLSSVIVNNYYSWISAQYIDFAVRKNIRIIESEKGIFKQKSYKIELISTNNLTDSETQILKAIFGHHLPLGGVYEFDASAPDYTLYPRIKLIKDAVGKQAVENGYYEDVKLIKRRMHKLEIVMGVLILFMGVSIVPLCVSLILSSSLKPLSKKGAELKDYLDGLKMYIKTAEEDRIKYLQSPLGAEKIIIDTNDNQAMVKLYERLLPYAVLFGNEKEWTKVLGKYYDQQSISPDWYSGSSVFNAAVFSSAISSFSSTSTLSSYSSSSSGSGGGGFSGGGGGGGGGGGW